MALGPEGPLVEEFWENMRRYALYALTVSTGVAYPVFQPILEFQHFFFFKMSGCAPDHPCASLDTPLISIYRIIREKPSSKDEARKFIKGYSGRHTTVVGSVVVTNLTKGTRKGGWEKSEVYFHDIPDHIIDSLIEEGMILNVAGGLMLEHPLTLPFVDTVIGTPDSVMGLSKSLTEKLIQDVL